MNEKSVTMRPISEYMACDPFTVGEDTSVLEAVGLMRDKKIGAVLVRDAGGQTIGIFTERDLLTRVDLANPEALRHLQIRAVMTRGLITADCSEDYHQVLDMMKEKNLRHLPITREGGVVGIVSLRDIMRNYEDNLESLLRKKEAQLLETLALIKDSEERFRSIFNNSAVAIAFADNNERVVAWNPLAEELLGMSKEEIFNKPVEDFYPPEEWQRIRSFNMRKFGKNYHLEVKMLHKSGALLDVDLSISVLKDASGNVVGSIGLMKDIGDRKRAEEKLELSHRQLELANKDLADNARVLKEMVEERERTNRKLRETQQQIIQVEKMATVGTLAAGFAHEIKNPLAIILQGMERIEKIAKDSGNDKYQEYVKVIRGAAQRANDVVTSILQYSRSAQLDLKPVNLYDVIDESIALIQSAAKTRNIIIQKHFSRVAHLLKGDNVMLQQVFFDLMTNSIDAMPDGGSIDIIVEFKESTDEDSKGGNFVVKVKDTGIGMDPQLLKKVFDPFFTTKEVGRGTGLGLSTVFLIVDKHEGQIQAESQKGVGTIITIVLPAD